MLEFKPVWSALWNTLGFANDRRREVHNEEVMFTALITKDCGVPSMIAPGQNERVLLWRIARTLPDEDYETVPSAEVKKGVSHGSGL